MFTIHENPLDELKRAIAEAQASEEGVSQSADGSDVPASSKWTTSAQKQALDDAIAAAKQVADNPESTKEEIEAATKAVREATQAYEDAKKYGEAKGTSMVATGDELPLIGIVAAAVASVIALAVAAVRRLRR